MKHLMLICIQMGSGLTCVVFTPCADTVHLNYYNNLINIVYKGHYQLYDSVTVIDLLLKG